MTTHSQPASAAEPSAPGASAGSAPTPTDIRQLRWWHMVLLYPTLAISLVGAVPSYLDKIEALRKGVQPKQLPSANDRTRLISKNLECLSAPITWVTTDNDTRVDATICHKTGDIVVRMNWGSDHQMLDVVSADGFREVAQAETQRAAGFLISNAHATALTVPVQQSGREQVICQRWIEEGRLLQRVQTPQGCFDQVLNTYRGLLESRRSASCERKC